MHARMRSALILLAVALAPARSFADAPLIVHEWGTFTSFQDERGATIAGINVDDEPVPAFVHRLKEHPVLTTTSLPALWSQGAPRCHSDVTLRLETPVIYFYPKEDMHDATIDVRATFNGGWITEFYPRGETEAAGFPGEILETSRGSIRWRDLAFGGADASMPQTVEHVWLAPRQVRASRVTTAAGETEKYLFYRGVGHVDAPLVVQQHDGQLTISLRAASKSLPALPRMWLVRVQPDGRVRFGSLETRKASISGNVPPASDARSDLDDLQEQMREALVGQGLFDDEARAMLETWRLSYFSSEGLRIFFLLPQAWTRSRLPLAVSPAAQITRVMMGRIELISDAQRAALENLYTLTEAGFPERPLYFDAPGVTKRGDHPRTHSDLYRAAGREVPPALTQYEALGRFRDSLLAHEWKIIRDEAKRARLRKVIDSFSACTFASPDGGL